MNSMGFSSSLNSKRLYIVTVLIAIAFLSKNSDGLSINDNHGNRRNFIKSVTASSAASLVVGVLKPQHALAAVDVSSQVEVPMKMFVDPKGLFALSVPQRFFTLRRTEKGDLPDEKTGKGRRGSSIFTAGDLVKTEIIAVERFPAATLLLDQGLEVKEGEDLSDFKKMGTPAAIAELLYLKRERETQQSKSRSSLLTESIKLSDDGKVLDFMLSTNIDVQKPELLLEQTGSSELIRITSARATLNSNDGNIMVCYGSALQQDFYGSSDGDALRKSIDSFTVTDNSR